MFDLLEGDIGDCMEGQVDFKYYDSSLLAHEDLQLALKVYGVRASEGCYGPLTNEADSVE